MAVELQANALTTLSAVLDELDLPRGDRKRDDRVRRLINELSDFVAGYCGRALHAATVTEATPGFGLTDLVLRRRPIISVATVTIDGSAETDFTVRDISPGVPGVLFRAGGWPNTAAARAGLVNQFASGTEESSIVVVYDGGFVTPHQVELALYTTRTLPWDLEGIVLRMAAARFADVGADPRVKSEEVLSASVTYRDGLPPEMTSVLDRYRVFPSA